MTTADELFKPTEMATILSTAILERMTEDGRTAMLAQAMQYLVTPTQRSNDYGNSRTGPTPVQQAFNQAAAMTIDKVTREILEADEGFKAKLREIVTDAIRQALEGDEAFRSAVTEGVGRAMAGHRW